MAINEVESAPKLRKMLFANRHLFRELESEGITRYELRDAVRAIDKDGEFPTGENHATLALLIVAQLAGVAKNPQAFNWDKIFELIEKLMPLIELWMTGC